MMCGRLLHEIVAPQHRLVAPHDVSRESVQAFFQSFPSLSDRQKHTAQKLSREFVFPEAGPIDDNLLGEITTAFKAFETPVDDFLSKSPRSAEHFCNGAFVLSSPLKQKFRRILAWVSVNNLVAIPAKPNPVVLSPRAASLIAWSKRAEPGRAP